MILHLIIALFIRLVTSTDFFDAPEPLFYSGFNLDDRLIIIATYSDAVRNGSNSLYWQYFPDSGILEEFIDPFWTKYFIDITTALTFDIVCPNNFEFCKDPILDSLRDSIIIQGNMVYEEFAFISFWKENKTEVKGDIKLPWNWRISGPDIRGTIFPEVEDISTFYSGIFLPKDRVMIAAGEKRIKDQFRYFEYFGHKRTLSADGVWSQWQEFMPARIKLTALFVINDILYGIATDEHLVIQFNENFNYIDKGNVKQFFKQLIRSTTSSITNMMETNPNNSATDNLDMDSTTDSSETSDKWPQQYPTKTGLISRRSIFWVLSAMILCICFIAFLFCNKYFPEIPKPEF